MIKFKSLLEARREHDIFRLYGAAFSDIPQLNLLSASPEASALLGDHVPQAAKDSALTAFAQLAAMRLQGTRALISLIDKERQHVLAESTPTMSLRSGSQNQSPGDLWLGNVSFPRNLGVCETVLDIDPACLNRGTDAAIVINDLAQSEQFSHQEYVQGNTMRFYTAVPLLRPSGAIVGALSVLDDKARDGIPNQDILYLQDLAATIMEHLDTYTLKDQRHRGEQLTRGLISFAEGASALQQYDANQDHHSPQPYDENISHPALQPYHDDAEIPALRPHDSNRSIPRPSTPVDFAQIVREPEAPSSRPHACGSVQTLQDSILPANSKAMFARAANIMRASSDLDGVLILDASIAAGGQQKQGSDTGESSYDSRSASGGEDSHLSHGSTRNSAAQPSPKNTEKRCHILGFSTPEASSVADNTWALNHRSPLESDLRRMLDLFPGGEILHFTADGEAISSTDESEFPSKTTTALERRQRHRHAGGRMQKTLGAIQATLPGARSVAFIPFWDFERSRWFAGCLCCKIRSPFLQGV